ncbi:RNA polymerase sigma factor [Streptomyces typhae]|nr:sigma-70 family RNA polymerase sigma factor [Streptomyces typhae]
MTRAHDTESLPPAAPGGQQAFGLPRTAVRAPAGAGRDVEHRREDADSGQPRPADALERSLPAHRTPRQKPPPAPSFEDLYQRLQPRLRRYVIRVLGAEHGHEADDVLQTAWIAVLPHWNRVSRMDHAEAYVYKVTRNETLGALRAAGRRNRLAPLADDTQLLVLAERHGPPRTSAADRVVDAEGVKQYIQKQLAPLLSWQQLAVLALDLDGYSTDMAADALHVEPSTVRAQRHRLRRKLKTAPRPDL